MPDRTSTLGPQERLLLTSLAGEGKRVFDVEDALPYWSSASQTRKALSRLVRKGWIERLERGVYLLVPLEAGLERQWSEDPHVIGTQLVSEGAIAYWTALHHWNLTEQVPRTVFVQTTARRNTPKTTILGVRYQFITVKPEKYFGIRSQSSNGMEFEITDREKTLVDACDRPDLCGGILQVARALHALDTFDWDKLDAYLERFGSGAVYKRLGYLVERLEVDTPERENRFARWQGKLTQGIAWLEPGGAGNGPVVTRWRIRVNSKPLEKPDDR